MGHSRALLVALLLVAAGATHQARADVLAFIAFDQNITLSPQQVLDLVAVSGGETLFQGEISWSGFGPVDGLLVRTTEEQFVFLASAPGMLPYPVSYLPPKNLSLVFEGYGCPYWEPGFDVETCMVHLQIAAVEGGSAAEVLEAVEEVGGVSRSTPPHSPGTYFVPAGQLEVLADDPRIGSVQLWGPSDGFVFDPAPAEHEDPYYQELFLGHGHRFSAVLIVESERVPDTGSLSRSGKRQYVSRDGGAFWILEPSNPEVFVKVLDGCSINGHYWLFVTGLTDLATTMQVSDYAGERFALIRTEDFEPYTSVFDSELFPCD